MEDGGKKADDERTLEAAAAMMRRGHQMILKGGLKMNAAALFVNIDNFVSNLPLRPF